MQLKSYWPKNVANIVKWDEKSSKMYELWIIEKLFLMIYRYQMDNETICIWSKLGLSLILLCTNMICLYFSCNIASWTIEIPISISWRWSIWRNFSDKVTISMSICTVFFLQTLYVQIILMKRLGSTVLLVKEMLVIIPQRVLKGLGTGCIKVILHQERIYLPQMLVEDLLVGT